MPFDFASALPRLTYLCLPFTPLLPWAIAEQARCRSVTSWGSVSAIVALVSAFALALLPNVQGKYLLYTAALSSLVATVATLRDIYRAAIENKRPTPLLFLVAAFAIAFILTRDLTGDPARSILAATPKLSRLMRGATWLVVFFTATLAIVPRLDFASSKPFNLRAGMTSLLSSLVSLRSSLRTKPLELEARTTKPRLLGFDFDVDFDRRFIALSILSGGAFFLVIRLAVRGALPSAAVAVLAPLTLLGTIAFAYRRHGFWVIAIATLVSLPTLGSFGLVDPWETHYAEVAREMIERRDWISPWWANEGWFMSKPVLTFWLEGISMIVFGVHTGPDQMLHVEAAHPEWAVRLPHFFLALLGTYFLYDGVAHTCGKRAGLLGAVVLWSMPGFALLSHQAMTDMPLVACLAGSLGLLLRATSSSITDATPAHPAARFGLALAIALVTLPQLAMLVLSHVHLDATGIHLRPDRLVAGSPASCGLPSQPACLSSFPAHPRLAPALQAFIWLPLVMFLIDRVLRERRAARLFAIAAWMFAAGAAMAKGPAGLAIPAAAAFVFALAKRSVRPLFRLEIITGLLLASAMILPWYLAAYARHGKHFIDELVMRHMLGRTLTHLHDTNDGEDVGIVYFIKQLGYATFPWSGISAFATLLIVRVRNTDTHSKRGAAKALLFGATIVSFTLVSTMGTKFHHYILLALPPIAMLTGIFVDELLSLPKRRLLQRIPIILSAALVTTVIARDLHETPARFIRLLTYRYARIWPSTSSDKLFAALLIAIAILAIVALPLLLIPQLRKLAPLTLPIPALALSLLLLDRYLPACARDGGQREVIAAFYADHPDTTLIAYQLNWKGENFYTGNRLAIFIASGAPLKSYLDKRRESGDRTFYFVTERPRVPGLRRELAPLNSSSFVELTPADVSAEFSLVRVRL